MSADQHFSSFIASKFGLNSKQEALSTLSYKLGVASIILGIACCIISCLVMVGFHRSIERRITGLLGDVIVSPLYSEGDFDTFRVSGLKQKLEIALSKDLAHAKCVQQQYVLLQNGELIEGAALHGVPIGEATGIERYVVHGTMPNPKKESEKREILLSQNLAKKLHLQLGAQVALYARENFSSIETFEIVGIYNTHLPDFDEKFVFCDARVMQEIFDWEDGWGTSVNCFLKNPGKASALEQTIEELAGPALYTRLIKDESSDIFEWIDVLYKNTVIFLIILLIVINTNIASIATIQLIERRYMVSVLNTLGATNWQLMKIFLLKNRSMIGKGLLYGNLVGLGICALEHFLKLVKLNSNVHYIEYAPVEWDWRIIMGINGVTLAVMSALLAASYFFVLETKFYRREPY